MIKFIILSFAICIGSCKQQDYHNPHVSIITSYGDIELELLIDKAPKTVAAFLSNVDAGLYREGTFYRVLKAEEFPTSFNTGIIQGGTYLNPGARLIKHAGIIHESTQQSGLSHTDGAISMASNGAGTATTEFFICIGDQSPLDAGRSGTPDGKGYAVFGKVFKGMDVVRKIQSQESAGDKFIKPIEIKNIKKR